MVRHAVHKNGNEAIDAPYSLLDALGSLNDGAPLNLYQRILLITDGTVTDVVAAFADESIRVVRLAQSFEQVGPCFPPLELFDGDRVLNRTVLIQGSVSGTNLVYADSVIAADRLPPEVLEGLLSTGKPLDRLLAENRVETRRELIELGIQPGGACTEFFGIGPESRLVFRTYRILSHRQPIARITEKFPLTWFSLPVVMPSL